MARTFSLQVLLDNAIHRREAAERLLRLLKRKEDAAREQLEQIRGYKAEYQTRMSDAGAHGLDIQFLRTYQSFLVKIDLAIEHQDKEVGRVHGNWEEARLKWMELRREVLSYEALAERQRTQEMRIEEKRDQRITDESAMRMHWGSEPD